VDREVEIAVLNRQRGRRVSRDALTRFLRQLVGAAPPQRGDQLSVCLVSDRRMREFNRRFRGIDRPTDVLAFCGDGRPGPDRQVHLGDIVISVPTAARQARERKHSLAKELKILTLHGYLHLLGHDHETDDGAMLRLQRRLTRRLLP
jgi:probable rRNA maturation factor